MTHPEPPDSNPPSGPRGLKGRRRVVSLDAGDSLVTTSTLSEHSSLPLIVQPALPGVDLAAWAETNSAQFETWLVDHGSVLLRGFGLVTPVEFETVVSALVPDLFADYGDLPKEESGQKIYHSTPYPHDMAILFHNESSHLPSWPTRQFFFCVQPSLVGGNTPLLDCELVMRKINPELLQRFTTKKLCYVRNFVPGVDVSWQDFFKTDDREQVERQCADEAMTCEWLGDVLRIKNVTEAIRRHPQRDTEVFFNQVQLHHSSCLDPSTRQALLDICGSEIALPRNVLYGDESPISDEDMQHLNDVFFEHCVQFPWQAGDIIAVDNMRASHARLPYEGPRKITVAMGRMATHGETLATAS